MWTGFLASCRAALPFLADNIVPLVNFVLLLLVFLELQRRSHRFGKIEKTLGQLQNGLETARQQRFAAIEHDVKDLQADADKAHGQH